MGSMLAETRRDEAIAILEAPRRERKRVVIIGGGFAGIAAARGKEPVRRRIHGIETFNVLQRGEYFFMPGISALKWLANLE